MMTDALSKLKSPEELSLERLPEVCRLCLRSEGIKFDIFEAGPEKKTPLNKRLKEFYDVTVTKDDDCHFPSKICHDCLFQVEVHNEFRDGVLENDKRLRKYLESVLPKAPEPSETVSPEEEYLRDLNGLQDFVPADPSSVIVIDPNKEYESSDEETEQETAPEVVEKIDLTNSPERDESSQQKVDYSKLVFMCQYCDLAFRDQAVCTEHEQTKHNPQCPFNCKFCPFSSTARSNLLHHLKVVHHTDKPFICSDCHKGFGRRSDLKKHSIVHTGIRPFTCPICNKKFSRNTNLTKHLRIHSGLKPHVCSRCPRTFVTHSDLVRHQLVHDGIRPFHCSICPSTFSRRDKLFQHEKIHYKKSTSAVFDPENMVIDIDPFSDVNPNMPYEFPRKFPEEIAMQENADFTIPDHFGNLDLSFQNHSNSFENGLIDELGAGFLCVKCQKQFPTQFALADHNQTDHLPPKNHVCTICLKTFSRRRELVRHSAIHTGSKPFKCETCWKVFGRKDKLLRHQRTHLEQPPKQEPLPLPPTMPSFSAVLNHITTNPMQPLPDLKDFSFKPNFYSQILIGDEPVDLQPPDTIVSKLD